MLYTMLEKTVSTGGVEVEVVVTKVLSGSAVKTESRKRTETVIWDRICSCRFNRRGSVGGSFSKVQCNGIICYLVNTR